MAGYGLYYALRGKNNWAQRRQDAQMNLQMQQEMTNMEAQNLQQNLLAEKELQDAFDAVRQMDYLEADKERIYSKEKQLRSNIVKQIGAYNGDLKRYMSAGGMSDLRDYQRSLEDSQEVKLAKKNKTELLRYIEDSKKGDRFFHRTKFRVPKFDEAGNQTGEFEERMIDMNEQLALFNKGAINTLSYAGSEKNIPVTMMEFKQYFKDESNPLGDNRVTQSDIYNYATQKGASHEQAMHHVNTYGDMIRQGGDVWRWKGQDPLEYAIDMQYKQAMTAKAKASIKAEAEALKQGTLTNQVISKLDRVQEGSKEDFTQDATNTLMQFAGYRKDKDGQFRSNLTDRTGYILTKEGDITPHKVRISGNNVTDVQPTGVVTKVGGRRMMEAVVSLDLNGDDSKDTAMQENIFGYDSALNKDIANYVYNTGDETYQHKVYIDIEDYASDELFKQTLVQDVHIPYSNIQTQNNPESLRPWTQQQYNLEALYQQMQNIK